MTFPVPCDHLTFLVSFPFFIGDLEIISHSKNLFQFSLEASCVPRPFGTELGEKGSSFSLATLYIFFPFVFFLYAGVKYTSLKRYLKMASPRGYGAGQGSGRRG